MKPGAGILAVLLVASCSPGTSSDGTTVPSTISGRAGASSSSGPDPLSEIPPESRLSDGGIEPRGADYWSMWSTCGDNSQAGVAAANGGAAEGWFLVDDVLNAPGVTLGEHDVTDCVEAVTLLSASSAQAPGADAVDGLAGQVMLAQLNLSTAGESCVAVEGGLAIANTLLTELKFTGAGSHQMPGTDIASAIDEVSALLKAYNAGQLCT